MVPYEVQAQMHGATATVPYFYTEQDLKKTLVFNSKFKPKTPCKENVSYSNNKTYTFLNNSSQRHAFYT